MASRKALALASAAALLGIAAQYLFVGERPGANVLLATALFLTTAWLLRPGVARPRARDAWIAAAALALAAACALRADVPLLVFDTAAVVALSLASVVAFAGIALSDLAVVRLAATAADACAGAVFRAGGVVAAALPAARALAGRRSASSLGYAGGLLLALPFLLAFGGLFSAADAVFAHAVQNVVDLARLRELLAELPGRAAVALVVAWFVAGVLAFTVERSGDARDTPPAFLRPETAIAMVLAIDALFAFFVVLQVAYLFGGRDTLDASGLPYSAYARRGFFELVAASALVAGLLFSLDLVASARTRRYTVAALALVALTFVVLASAAMRMDLYQAVYGWTELRFYASAAIAFLALVLGVLAWAVIASRMAFVLQRFAAAAVLVALAANAIGPSGFVASANLHRFLEEGELPADAVRDLDAGYLIGLGDGAVPAIVEALPRLPLRERAKLEDLLAFVARHRSPEHWQSWNAERERARELLAH